MADRFTIQRYPTALLPMLGMQNMGDTPSELSPVVSAMIDVSQLYVRDRLRCGQVNFNINVAGQFTQVPVQPNEQWLVYGFNSLIVQAAATTGRYRNLQLLGSLSPSPNIGLGNSVALAAGEQANVGWWFEQPKLFRTNDQWGVTCEVYTGVANSTCSVSVVYVPLQI